MSHSLEIVPGASTAHVRDRVMDRQDGVKSVLTPFLGLTLHGMAIRRAAKLINSTITCATGTFLIIISNISLRLSSCAVVHARSLDLGLGPEDLGGRR